MKISAPIKKLKRNAKLRSRSTGQPLHAALDQVASEEGFKSWSHLMRMKPHVMAGVVVAFAAFPAHAQSCDAGMRAFEHHVGTTCVPADPQRIVALSDQNMMLPLMELGVAPVGSIGRIRDDGTTFFRRLDGFDTQGVAWIGVDGDAPDPEAVAVLEPDLIIAPSFRDFPENLTAIAPVVVIDTVSTPIDEVLLQFADLVNRTERGEEFRGDLQETIVQTRAEVGDAFATTTVSVLEVNLDEEVFFPVGSTQAFSGVFPQLNLTRPEPERNLGSDRPRTSFEALQEHNADVMFVLVEDMDEAGQSETLDRFLAHPLVQTLDVAQAGQIYALNANQTYGVSWQRPQNIMNRLSEVITDPELDRNVVLE